MDTMPVNKENQDLFRVFLKAVRIECRLSVVCFSPLIGISKSTLYTFEQNKEYYLTYRTLVSMFKKLPLNNELINAMFDTNAPPIALPTPESIVDKFGQIDLQTKEIVTIAKMEDFLIDTEMAEKILEIIKVAGKPIPLSLICKLIR